MLPTAAAFEQPARVGQRAVDYFGSLGLEAKVLSVLHRGEAEDPKIAALVRKAKFVYLSDGSPLHLRSVLKDSALFESLLAVYHGGGVVAASGAGATLLGDPMVDPRGGAYTVGFGRGAQSRRVPVSRHRGRAPPGAFHRPAPRVARPSSGSTSRPRSWHRGSAWRVVGVVGSASTAVTATRSRTRPVPRSTACPPD